MNASSSSQASSDPKLPTSRIRTIMKSSPETLNIGQDALFATAKAVEFFIEVLVQDAFEERRRKEGNRVAPTSLEYGDLAEYVQNNGELFEFLRDILPKKIKASECLRLIRDAQAREKEKNEAIAALLGPSATVNGHSAE